MDLENIKINSTDSITLSADTIINSATWATATGTALPRYTISTSTATIPIEDIEILKNDLKNAPLTMFTETINTPDLEKMKNYIEGKKVVKKEEKLDPRIVKINKEIAELRDKTWFYSIKEYVPNKVYGFTFPYSWQKSEYKTICADEDTFDLEFAFFLAYAKYLHTNELTTEGYVDIARTLSYNKRNLKKVKNGIKLFHKLQERDALEEQIKAEKKHRHDKLVQKKIEKKNRKKDEQIKIIRTAIEASK